MSTRRGKTEIRSFKIEELLEWARGGRLRLPDFQRKLRWEARHVVELFDSIYNSYPIGTLLLAKRPLAPAETHFGPASFPPREGADTHWIIDGQQRLTSIVGTLLHPDLEPRHDQFAVYFDLEKEKFFTRRRRDIPLTSVPLRELRDSTAVLTWLRRWPLANERPELEPRIFELSRAVREFTVAAAIVEGDDSLLRSIFVRTNRAGVDMKEAEVFEALYGLSPEQSIAAAAARLSSGSMGEIEADTLLRCAKHIATVDPGARPENLPSVDRSFVEKAETALRRVLLFLADDCQLPHLELVHQRFVLMPLSRYFAFFSEPSPRARRLLRRWVWRGLVNGSFDQTGFGPIRQYERLIVPDESDEVVAAAILNEVKGRLSTVDFPARWSSANREAKFLAALLLSRLSDQDLEEALVDLNHAGTLTKAGRFLSAQETPEFWVPKTTSEDPIIEPAVRREALHQFLIERCEVDANDRPSVKLLVGAA